MILLSTIDKGISRCFTNPVHEIQIMRYALQAQPWRKSSSAGPLRAAVHVLPPVLLRHSWACSAPQA